MTAYINPSKTDEWETPQDLFNTLDLKWDFGLDACATEQNKKCENYFSIEDNGLNKDWHGTVWCNPPYSELKAWIRKAYEESLKGATVVMLIPARTDTKAWHEYIFPYAKIEFLKGRLKFSNSRNNAPFPSAIIIFEGIKNVDISEI